MNELKQALKKVLANTFSFYLKSHFYHWNVKGADFAQYHNFLSDIYEGTFEFVDTIAEQIRTLDEMAPGSLKRYSELTDIKDAESMSTTQAMFETLMSDNEVVLKSIITAYDLAEKNREIGVSNFLQGMYEDRKKLSWMLKSITAKV